MSEDAHVMQRRDFLKVAAATGAALTVWKNRPATKKAIEKLRATGHLTGGEPVSGFPELYNTLSDAVLELFDAVEKL
jgi:hypothetical protein